MLIQLAKISNAYSTIIAVASIKHEKVLKSYGADSVYDYHDNGVIEKITKRYPNIQHLVDAVSDGKGSIKSVASCASLKEQSLIVQLTNFFDVEALLGTRRDNVKIEGTLVYLITGREVSYGTTKFSKNLKYRETAIDFINFITPKIVKGELHHIPAKIFKNGLREIPQILDDICKGTYSGIKLVATL